MIRHRPAFALALALGLACAAPAAAQDSTATRPAPCSAPEHRQFDFWIGEWDVTTADGKPAGTNRIERIAGGCGLLESWTGATGGVGTSINFWSPEDRRWHQTWVGSWASFLFLAGGLEDGRMVMGGVTTTADGREQRERITWMPLADGRVRQHWQQSLDGGATWTDAFVGLYTRRKAGKN